MTLPRNIPLIMRHALACLFLAAFAFGASLALCSQQAHAAFNDVADSFPAAQELGSYGSIITGSDLPDGTYQVGARTTSRMCILYTDPANAEARDSKEQAIVIAEGGELTAVFYISKAYTHLYLGTQEEAAAQTNEDGTDASAYIAGDPDEGYVPHMFTLPISALNDPITVSTYSGGDKGLEKGKWYTREVVFKMTDAELEAAIAAANPDSEPESESSSSAAEEEEDADDDGSADSGGEDEQDGDDGEDEEGVEGGGDEGSGDDDDDTDDTDDGDDEDTDEDDSDDDDDDDEEEEEEEENDSDDDDDEDDSDDAADDDEEAEEENDAPEAQPVLTADNVTGGGEGESGDGSGQGGGQASEAAPEGQEASGEGEQAGQATSTTPGAMRGVRMNIVGSDLVIDTSGLERAERDENDDAGFTVSADVVLALGVLAAFVLGIALRGILFTRAFDLHEGPPLPPKVGHARN